VILDRRKTLLVAGATLAMPGVIRNRPAFAAAPMLGPARPQFYRFQLGDFEVTTLRDGAVQVDGPHPIFGEDQPAEDVAAFAEENFLPADRMEISFTPVLVNTGEALVLFDSGNVADRRPGAGNLVAAIEAAGYTADQVGVVVITHMHGDHIGGLMTDGVPTYPNAAYVTGEIEYDFWSHDDRLSGPTEGGARLVRSNVVPLAETMRFIGDEGEVVPGISAIAAFGHTPGHMAYHIESAGSRLMLWADARTIMFSRCSSRTGTSASTWTRRRRSPRAGDSSTWPMPSGSRSPATTCRSRPWASSTRRQTAVIAGFRPATSCISSRNDGSGRRVRQPLEHGRRLGHEPRHQVGRR
jgi:glyoxylase-like metal-dependent hydrolase (beta-lactamase superfamily II)